MFAEFELLCMLPYQCKGAAWKGLLHKERQTWRWRQHQGAAALLKRTKYLNKESRSDLVTVAMIGRSPIITKQDCNAKTGLGPGQRAKSAGQDWNEGGMCSRTCSMTQTQSQDDSLSLSPAPRRSGGRLPKKASRSFPQGLHQMSWP